MWLRPSVVALTCLVCLVPPGHAALVLEVEEGPTAPLEIGATASVRVAATIDCLSILQRIRPERTSDVLMEVGTAGPADAYIEGPSELAVATAPCLEGQQEVRATIPFTVGMHQSARALDPRGFQVHASLEETPLEGQATEPARGQVTFMAEAAPRVVISIAETPRVVSVGPDGVPFTFRISNRGNTPVSVSWSMQDGATSWDGPVTALSWPNGEHVGELLLPLARSVEGRVVQVTATPRWDEGGVSGEPLTAEILVPRMETSTTESKSGLLAMAGVATAILGIAAVAVVIWRRLR